MVAFRGQCIPQPQSPTRMQAPVPSHILRTHAASVTAVAFSPDNERLYSGDGSGRVVITSTRSLRLIAAWSAHTDGILGVHEWAEAASILTCVSRRSQIHSHLRAMQAWKGQ